MKKKLIALSLVALGFIAFSSPTQSLAADGDVTCSGNTCVVEGAKNRFLAKGCKDKESFWCETGVPGGGVKIPVKII
jgi:hypothetical protein